MRRFSLILLAFLTFACNSGVEARADLTLPSYHSSPGARYTVYLDFVGTNPETWLNFGLPFGTAVPAIPAYTLDADATSFSAAELANISTIEQRVASYLDFASVDVTNVDPGGFPGFGGAGRVRAVIGGDNSWTGTSVAGVGYPNSFRDPTLGDTVYTFPSVGFAQYPDVVSDNVLHELGHALGGLPDEQALLADGAYNVMSNVLPPPGAAVEWNPTDLQTLTALLGPQANVPEVETIAPIMAAGVVLIRRRRQRIA